MAGMGAARVEPAAAPQLHCPECGAAQSGALAFCVECGGSLLGEAEPPVAVRRPPAIAVAALGTAALCLLLAMLGYLGA